MSLYKKLIFALCLISFVSESIGQDGTETITIKELQEHLDIIASDSMMGRSLKEKSGLQMTADYLEQQAAEVKLKPVGSSYSQKFNIISSSPAGENDSLFVYNKSGKTVLKTNSIIGLRQTSDNSNFKGDLVFTGFGWQDKKQNYDDLKGIDISGKIIICATGSPETFGNKNLNQWDSDFERSKTDRLFKHGARAVILITHPADTEQNVFNRFRRRSKRTNYFVYQKNQEGKVLAVALPGVADKILRGKGKYNTYLQTISKKMEPNSFQLKNSFAQIKINRQNESILGTNVIGIVEGSDPILKDECIVYMAHYDHLGINKNGEIYNGADDNGSGTVALLELAEAFSNPEITPSRSLVFAWVTGEEVGLLGSEYFTQYPAFPLEKTVACINLDMIGRVNEPRDTIWKKSPKMVKDFDGIYALISDFSPHLKTLTDSICTNLGLNPDYSLPDSFFRTSDHHYFHSNGVPILNLATGYHADYHKTTDEVSKINFKKIKRVTDLAFLVGLEMANKNMNN